MNTSLPSDNRYLPQGHRRPGYVLPPLCARHKHARENTSQRPGEHMRKCTAMSRQHAPNLPNARQAAQHTLPRGLQNT